MSEPDKRRDPVGKSVAEGLVTATEQFMDTVSKPRLKDVSFPKRIAIKRISGLGGNAMDVAEIWTGEDKLREAVGAIGGWAGGAAGAAFGGLSGPGAVVYSPIGAAVGSHYGEKGAEYLYDEYADDVRRGIENGAAGIRRGAGSIEEWMKARARGVMDRRLYRY